MKVEAGVAALVITNVVMPKLGGVQAVSRMREIRPDIRVIFSTGYDKSDSFAQGVPADDACLLPRPYDIGRLNQAIRNILDDL